MKKRKLFFCLAAILVVLIVCAAALPRVRQAAEDAKYRSYVDLLLKSSGWEPLEEISFSHMTFNGFEGSLTAANGTEYNIPGFVDVFSEKYTKVSSVWIADTEGEVITFHLQVRDATGVLPEEIPLICELAFCDGQVGMARIFVDWESYGYPPESFWERIPITSWPITEDKNTISSTLSLALSYFNN